MLMGLLVNALLSQDKPYHVSGDKVNQGDPRPVAMFFTQNPDVVVIAAKDNQLRWIDLKKDRSKVVRTGELKDVPTFDFSGKEAVSVEKAREATVALFGSDNYYPLQGLTRLRVPGDKEFCLTNRLNQFFFYSTETGDVTRKVFLKTKFKDYHPCIEAISPNAKYAMTGDNVKGTESIWSLETGELVLTVPCPFMASAAFLPDNESVITLEGPKLTTYSLKTKKPVGTPVKLPFASTGLVAVNPDGKSISFSVYEKGDSSANAIYELSTRKVTLIDPKLKGFRPKWYSPDGSLLIMYEPKWMHIVDAHTGVHKFTYAASFPDVWDVIYEANFSPDNSRLILVPDPNLMDVRYAISVNLAQAPGKPVTKYGP